MKPQMHTWFKVQKNVLQYCGTGIRIGRRCEGTKAHFLVTWSVGTGVSGETVLRSKDTPSLRKAKELAADWIEELNAYGNPE